MQVLHVVRFERYRAKEQGEKDDTCTPKISLEALVPLIFDDFGCDIGRSATLFVHDLARFDGFRDAKVSNFDPTLTVEEDVIKLDITM